MWKRVTLVFGDFDQGIVEPGFIPHVHDRHLSQETGSVVIKMFYCQATVGIVGCSQLSRQRQAHCDLLTHVLLPLLLDIKRFPLLTVRNQFNQSMAFQEQLFVVLKSPTDIARDREPRHFSTAVDHKRAFGNAFECFGGENTNW